MKQFITLFCIFTWSALPALYAQNRIYVNEYLNIGIGGRGLAMGGAQVASTKDVTAGYWNPAGLTRIQDNLQVGLMHAEYFAGNAKYDYGAVALPLKNKKRALALSVLRFATDDIPYTIDYIRPDGTFDESKLKSISAGDYAFLLSYAQELKVFKDTAWRISAGANAKVVYRNIGAMANAWGMGADIGIQARRGRLQLGAAIKDITTTYTTWSFHLTEKEQEVFGETGNEIPVKSYEVMLPRMNIGIGWNFMKARRNMQLLAELNADITSDGMRNTLIRSSNISIDPRLGFELSYKRAIFLRAGVCNIQQALNDQDTTNRSHYTLFQPSAGIGLQLGPLMVDYAYTSLQTQSNPLFSHIVSVRFDYNRIKRPGKLEPNTDLNHPIPAE
jgi:hypothetical protein